MKEILDGGQLRDMILCANAALEHNKALLNDLNVFPVPDGDTGTNMSLTMQAAANALLQKQPELLSEVAEIAASALLRGARGNSGVILSLLFRGMAKALKGKETADTYTFAYALTEGVNAAYKAVMKPAEGTILSVSRAATTAALEFAENGSDIELMLTHALEVSKAALEDTTRINPVLKKAGVVDAGGKGYVLILDAMLASLQGRQARPATLLPASQSPAKLSAPESAEIHFAYCTEFIVSREHEKPPAKLTQFLQHMGDSTVVVEDDDIIKVHIHTNEPGHVLTEALTYGALLTVKIENMREQHTELQTGAASETSVNTTETLAPADVSDDVIVVSSSPVKAHKPFAVVAVSSGEGLTSLFLELGADAVVSGGQTMNPATEDILREIETIAADVIYVLPNNKNIIMAAQQCVSLTEKHLVIIPTKTIPQGVAAMLAMDTYASEEVCTAAMTEAIAAVNTALITYAARDSHFDGHNIAAGEYLSLLNDTLLGNYTSETDLLEELCIAFLDLSTEFISIYYGEDVREEEAEIVSSLFTEQFPHAEVSLIYGGQPVYRYMIACE